MSRGARARQGQETVDISDRGWYQSPSGQRVTIEVEMQACLAGTTLHRPEELSRLVKAPAPPTEVQATSYAVTNETTLSAAHRLVVFEGKSHVLALNFASAKNPGGGFLGGSQAQEESLARSSGLYRSLLTLPSYYEANRAHANALYTDHMIVSPGVPVFRGDDGELLETTYCLSIITSPAVNAGAVQTNSPQLVSQILPTMRVRTEKLLALAAHLGYEHLLLGACDRRQGGLL